MTGKPLRDSSARQKVLAMGDSDYTAFTTLQRLGHRPTPFDYAQPPNQASGRISRCQTCGMAFLYNEARTPGVQLTNAQTRCPGRKR